MDKVQETRPRYNSQEYPHHQSCPSKNDNHKIQILKLLLASFLVLYFELVIIRYLSTEIRIFAYMKNLPLIASFFGIGLGMVRRSPPKVLWRLFPFIAFLLFFQISFAPLLNLTHTPFPAKDYYVYGTKNISGMKDALIFIWVMSEILFLTVAFFLVLGTIVGEQLSCHAPLCGYGANLVGSLLGIVTFTVLAFYNLSPFIWILLGFFLLMPFFYKQRAHTAVFILLVAMTFVNPQASYWSPYYRIDLHELPHPAEWSRPSAYELSVNHDYHQKIVDLSPQFLSRFPHAEPNRSAVITYEFPYRFVSNPGNVLIVGAGTGNDVAAALRNGAYHVDAVEIDPVIQRLGILYHPERPYDSPKVTVHIDDARAFFNKTKKKYDLIVFGYLDAHTLLSSFSSIRLDNFVYTLESFREAKNLLKDDGTLVLAIASGGTFVSKRVFNTLERAFGIPPHVYSTGYDVVGMVFVEGEALKKGPLSDFLERSGQLYGYNDALIATDDWPFLYMASRTIPVSIACVLVLFLYCSWIAVHKTLPRKNFMDRLHLHFFFLGAGFLLLETRAVTEMSLLFGSTWITNAIVIGAFLLMAILANFITSYRPVSLRVSYSGLFLLLGLSFFIPFSILEGLPVGVKILASGIFVGLPVFFTGLIFSRSFKLVANPSQVLGINLFGSVIGGALENFVMIGGSLIVGILAIMIYFFSVISLPIGGGK